jgi:Domain of unknown function (DUF4337)
MSDLAEQIQELQEKSERGDRFNGTVAIIVALFSAFLAFSKIKDDNIVQAIQKAQIDATDSWNQYQAKRQRQFQLQIEVSRMQAMIADGALKDSSENRTLLDGWRKEADRYSGELQDLNRKATDLQASLDTYNGQDDLFDFSDAFLTLSLVLLALAALTRVNWLLAGAVTVGLMGIAYGISGFFDFSYFKPVWLATVFGA